MIVREFTEKDIDEITALMKSLCSLKGAEYDEGRWMVSLERHLKNHVNSEVIVAFNDKMGQVIGMAQCSIRNSEEGFKFGYFSNLIVQEERRRLGIGEALMRHAIDFFKRNHIHSIRLALKSQLDEAAKTLFKKLGFSELITIYELKI